MILLFLISFFLFYIFIYFYFYYQCDFTLSFLVLLYLLLFLIIIFFFYINIDDLKALFISDLYTNSIFLNIILFFFVLFVLYKLFSSFFYSFLYTLNINIFFTMFYYSENYISLTRFIIVMLCYILLIAFAVYILFSVSSVLVGALVALKGSIVSSFTSCTGHNNSPVTAYSFWAQNPGNLYVDPIRFQREHRCYEGCFDGGPGLFHHQAYFNRCIYSYLCINCGLGRRYCNCWRCVQCGYWLIDCICDATNVNRCVKHGAPVFNCTCHYLHFFRDLLLIRARARSLN